MGLYDEIRWDAALPEGHPPDSRLFQTKSLDPCMDHYVVTPEGRLLLVGSGFEDGADLADREISQGVDVEFHGDMRLLSAEGYREYLARFTHGALEWIRPVADGEPWNSVAAAWVKFAHSRSSAKIGRGVEQPERGEGSVEENIDEHMTKPKAE
jgi:hypothetical protein